jgi:hypothetical protein
MNPKSLLKMATVASSVLLLGAFVSYRAGAFNRLVETSAPPADSGTRPSAEEKLSDGAPQPDPTIMSSSKSMIIHVPPSFNTRVAKPPDTAQQSPPKTTERERTLMPGSKAPIIASSFNKLAGQASSSSQSSETSQDP